MSDAHAQHAHSKRGRGGGCSVEQLYRSAETKQWIWRIVVGAHGDKDSTGRVAEMEEEGAGGGGWKCIGQGVDTARGSGCLSCRTVRGSKFE